MNPAFPPLLLLLASIVAASPPTLDHLVARWLKGAQLFMATTAIGIVAGVLATGIDMWANGTAFADALRFVGEGCAIGLGTAIVNVLKGGSASGGGVTLPATDGGPAPGANGAFPPASPRMIAARLFGGLFARFAVAIGAPLVLAVVISGCATLQNLFGSAVPDDVKAIYSCVTKEISAGDTNLGKIAIACDKEESQLVLDVVDTLVHSTTGFAADHPAEVAALRPQVAARRMAASDASAP